MGKRINIRDLKFYQNEILGLAEAMQYAFHDQSESEYDRYWLGQAIARTRTDVCDKIEQYMHNNSQALENSPILKALLNTYLLASKTVDPNELKAIYTEFQNYQKEVPFEENKQAYFDAGCMLTNNIAKHDDVYVAYPIPLYQAYCMHGGIDDNYRGIYFYPEHKLSKQEVQELYSENPELFENLWGISYLEPQKQS